MYIPTFVTLKYGFSDGLPPELIGAEALPPYLGGPTGTLRCAFVGGLPSAILWTNGTDGCDVEVLFGWIEDEGKPDRPSWFDEPAVTEALLSLRHAKSKGSSASEAFGTTVERMGLRELDFSEEAVTLIRPGGSTGPLARMAVERFS